MHDRTSTARPLAVVHIQSFDHLVFRAILSHYLTILAFIVKKKSHIDVRYISKFTAFISHNGCSESCGFRTGTFPLAIFLGNNIHFFSVASVRAPIVRGPFSTRSHINPYIMSDDIIFKGFRIIMLYFH